MLVYMTKADACGLTVFPSPCPWGPQFYIFKCFHCFQNTWLSQTDQQLLTYWSRTECLQDQSWETLRYGNLLFLHCMKAMDKARLIECNCAYTITDFLSLCDFCRHVCHISVDRVGGLGQALHLFLQLGHSWLNITFLLQQICFQFTACRTQHTLQGVKQKRSK